MCECVPPTPTPQGRWTPGGRKIEKGVVFKGATHMAINGWPALDPPVRATSLSRDRASGADVTEQTCCVMFTLKACRNGVSQLDVDDFSGKPDYCLTAHESAHESAR